VDDDEPPAASETPPLRRETLYVGEVRRFLNHGGSTEFGTVQGVVQVRRFGGRPWIDGGFHVTDCSSGVTLSFSLAVDGDPAELVRKAECLQLAATDYTNAVRVAVKAYEDALESSTSR
jgi:hypothetical protein